MKKIYFYILCVSILWGCSLDQKNQDEISGDTIINTVQKAYSVLAEAYAGLPMQTGNFTILSDDLQPRYTINYNSSTKAYYAWKDSEIMTISADIWQKYYQSLIHINALLATENNITDKTEEWNYIKGNALLLKAYIYFDLLQLYSERFTPSAPGIIAKDNLQVENNKRLTQEESIKAIQSLLDQGIDLVEKHSVQANYFITTPAAKNLQAQVYLFTKEYDKAEKTAKELINLFPDMPNHETAYSAIWNTPLQKNASAVYWIYNYQNNPNQFLYYEKDKGDYFYINHFFTFDKEDIRSQISQYLYTESDENKPEYYFLGKYKTTHTANEARNMVLSRNTESYFILIESLIEQNKVEQARNYLNIFLSTVNNPPLSTELSQNSLRLIMRHEKQKEFIGEKINFFDLKRWEVSIARYQTDSNNRLSTISNTDYRWTWPIPDSEMRYNNRATQNEGWPKIK